MAEGLRDVPRDLGPVFEYLQPLIWSWRGVSGKGVALVNTAVSDASQYAGDFANAGTGTLSFRAVAGAHSLTVTGTGVAVSGLAVTGNLSVGGNLSVTGTGTFAGSVTGDAGTFTSLSVTPGGGSIAANLSVGGSVTVTANLTANNVTASVQVAGTQKVIAGATAPVGSESLRVAGASRLEGALTVTTGGMTVSGNSSLTGTWTTSGALTVSSGGAAIAGNSTVTGTLTVTSSLTVSAGGAAITGNSSVTGTLSAGATTVSTLTASSTIDASGNITTSGGAVIGVQLFSTIATGTAPMSITSTTKVNNLNVNYLEGHGASDFLLLASGGTVSAALTVTGTMTASGTLVINDWSAAVSGDDLVWSDDAAAEIVRFGDTSSTYHLKVTGPAQITGLLNVGGNFQHTSSGGAIGFFNATPNTKQTVTGSRGGNAALQSLLSALANYGLITDSSS